MEIEKRIEKLDDDYYVEIYHKKGDISFWHREDGPARIEYNKYDLIEYESYWVNNDELSKEQWEREFGWKKQLKGTPMGEIFGVRNE